MHASGKHLKPANPEGKYESLKAEYNLLISRRPKKVSRGGLRAYIGTLEYVTEMENSGTTHGKNSIHTEAFAEAIEDARRISTPEELFSRTRAALAGFYRIHSRENLYQDSKPDGVQAQLGELYDCYGSIQQGRMKAVSLYSGAMGLDLGIMQSGFQILLANDIDRRSMETVVANLPGMKFINSDIEVVTSERILEESGMDAGNLDLLVGGPPCQPFSPAGKRAALNDPRASPLRHFIRAVKDLRPRAFVMEEVPGILSSRLKHFPYYDKYERKPSGEEVRGSAFAVIMEMMRDTGYNIEYRVLNSADYGTPQVRKRVIFIGMRDGIPTFPQATHSGNGEEDAPQWKTFWESSQNLHGCSFRPLSVQDQEFMSYVPPGGSWLQMPEEVARRAMGGAFESEGGRMGFYRRIAWDEPTPTVVTSPLQKGTYFVHPFADRPLSLEEYKRAQGFPDSWKITGKLDDMYRLIGNAVPVQLSSAVGRHVAGLLEGAWD